MKCEDCNGEGEIRRIGLTNVFPCYLCKGTGIQPKPNQFCSRCGHNFYQTHHGGVGCCPKCGCDI